MGNRFSPDRAVNEFHWPSFNQIFPWSDRSAILPRSSLHAQHFLHSKRNRHSDCHTGNVLATAFAGLIAAGIFHGMNGTAGLAGWRWLFILQGTVTFVVAVIGYFCLPDFPLTTKWLTPEERQLAHARMEEDTVGNQGKVSVWEGLRQACTDPCVALFALMAHMHLAANGFKNFVSLHPTQ